MEKSSRLLRNLFFIHIFLMIFSLIFSFGTNAQSVTCHSDPATVSIVCFNGTTPFNPPNPICHNTPLSKNYLSVTCNIPVNCNPCTTPAGWSATSPKCLWGGYHEGRCVGPAELPCPHAPYDPVTGSGGYLVYQEPPWIEAKCPLECYDNNGVYADFGSIPIDNFGYFNDESGNPQTDADQSSGACTCVQGTVWDSNGKCCGDDVSDCGQITSGLLCSIGLNTTLSSWISSAANPGDIRYLKCFNSEYLSDGNSWKKCEGFLWKQKVSNNEYLCSGKGRQTIAECCGDANCQSKIDGKRLTTGQSVKSSGTTGTIHLRATLNGNQCTTANPCTFSYNGTSLTAPSDVTAPANTDYTVSSSSVTPPAGYSYSGATYDINPPILTAGNTLTATLHFTNIIGGVIFNVKNKITGNSINEQVRIVDDITSYNGVLCSQHGSGWEGIGIGKFCKHLTTFDRLSPNNQRAIEDISMRGSTASCLAGWECIVSFDEVMSIKTITLSTTDTYTLLDNIESPGTEETSTCSPGWQDEGLTCAACTKYCKHFTTVFVQVPPSTGTIHLRATLNGNQCTTANPCTFSYNGNSLTAPSDVTAPANTDYTVSSSSVTPPPGYSYSGATYDINPPILTAGNTLTATLHFVSSIAGTGTVYVSATLNDAAWDGNLVISYNSPTGLSSGSTISTGVYPNQPIGTYSILLTPAPVGPAGATFGSVAPSSSQTLTSGGSIIFTFNFFISGSGSNATYYCRTDSIFVTDLDTPNSQLNDAALNNKNKKTCEKAGFAWTGTKCCSEDDDPHEYYNDPNGTGGCWDKKTIPSLSFVNGTNNSVANYMGVFHGCAIKPNLLGLLDTHTGSPLIVNHEHCFSDPDNAYYCSFTGQWLLTDGADKSHLSSAPAGDAIQSAGCCAKDQCWDGANCTSNQRAKPLSQAINGYRCIDGNWMQSDLKESMDGSTFGYCPSNSQCLVNVFANNESAQCINSSQYIDDNYCEDGSWTSRTKLLALKLLKLKSADYILFCDNRENALNNLQYLTGSGEIVSNVLSNIQTNNFCVLKSGSKVIAATSINKNLDNLSSKNFNIFGVTDCSSAFIDDGQYHSCDSTSKVWLNKKLKSFIYSSSAINVQSTQETSSFIMNFINSIIDAIKRLISQPPFDESYLNSIKRFYRLYMAEQAGKFIRGSIEGKTFRNAVIQYSGFDADICDFVNQFNQANNDVSSGISCKKEGNNYYVLAQGSQLSNLDPDFIWPDLTSKLRLK